MYFDLVKNQRFYSAEAWLLDDKSVICYKRYENSYRFHIAFIIVIWYNNNGDEDGLYFVRKCKN